MKNRLQSLWAEVMPAGGPCPQPDVKRVQRRVDAALDENRRTFYPWRVLRLAAAGAAALALLTGAAAAAGVLPLPELNALNIFYNKGGNAPGADGLMDTQPVIVSNDLFTVTLTSSLADENIVYLTAAVQPKTRWAQSYLEQEGVCADSFRLEPLSEMECVSPAQTHFTPQESGAQCSTVEIITATTADRRYAIHVFDPVGGPCKDGTCPGGDCRAEFTVKPTTTHTVTVEALGTAVYKPANDAIRRSARRSLTRPVYLQEVQISPLSLRVNFSAALEEESSTLQGFDYLPLLRFLWADGTASAAEEMGISPISGGGDGAGGRRYFYEQLWVFDAVQDLSQLEAVVFEGMAYPVDKGEPYPVDVDALTLREPAQLP